LTKGPSVITILIVSTFCPESVRVGQRRRYFQDSIPALTVDEGV
jgi:hypothetical protein